MTLCENKQLLINDQLSKSYHENLINRDGFLRWTTKGGEIRETCRETSRQYNFSVKYMALVVMGVRATEQPRNLLHHKMIWPKISHAVTVLLRVC